MAADLAEIFGSISDYDDFSFDLDIPDVENDTEVTDIPTANNDEDLSFLWDEVGDLGPSAADSGVPAAAAVAAIVVCVGGTAGNLLVLWAILGRRRMRTPQNFLIAFLAVSDLLLCVLWLPVSMWELLIESWPFSGEAAWLCRLMVVAKGVPLFMSSSAICAIALNRYVCVMNITR